MTQLKMNGDANGNSHTNGNGNANGNGHFHSHSQHEDRTPPQVSFSETQITPSSFFGKLRKLYSEQVLKTQLDQLKNQGSYDAFKLEWHPAYEVRRLHGAKMRVSLGSILQSAQSKQNQAMGTRRCKEQSMTDIQTDGIPPSLFWESDVGKW